MASTALGARPPARREAMAGRVLSGLVILFMVTDGAIKLVPIQPVYDAMVPLGWPYDPALMRLLGVISLGSTLLYAFRRTALIGAILLTAYLGGAVAAHVRVGDPLFSHDLFGVYLGVLLWAGLYLRDPRLRALLR